MERGSAITACGARGPLVTATPVMAMSVASVPMTRWNVTIALESGCVEMAYGIAIRLVLTVLARAIPAMFVPMVSNSVMKYWANAPAPTARGAITLLVAAILVMAVCVAFVPMAQKSVTTKVHHRRVLSMNVKMAHGFTSNLVALPAMTMNAASAQIVCHAVLVTKARTVKMVSGSIPLATEHVA